MTNHPRHAAAQTAMQAFRASCISLFVFGGAAATEHSYLQKPQDAALLTARASVAQQDTCHAKADFRTATLSESGFSGIGHSLDYNDRVYLTCLRQKLG